MDLANVSEGFKNFMFDLKDWIDNDFQNKDGQYFCRGDSICFQVDNWAKVGSELHNEAAVDLYLVLGGGIPFNKDVTEYGKELQAEDHYQNPKRLVWINETVAALKGYDREE